VARYVDVLAPFRPALGPVLYRFPFPA